MQGNTAEDLHVVVNHVPLGVVSASNPVVRIYGIVAFDAYEVFGSGQIAVEVGSRNHNFFVLGETSGSVVHNAERHGHHLVESHFVHFEGLFLQLVNLIEQRFALVDGRFFYLCFQFGNFFLLFFCRVLHIRLYLFGLGAQLVVAKGLYFVVRGLNFFNKWLDKFHVARRLIAEERL